MMTLPLRLQKTPDVVRHVRLPGEYWQDREGGWWLLHQQYWWLRLPCATRSRCHRETLANDYRRRRAHRRTTSGEKR